MRFYIDFSGGHDLDVFGLRNLVFFGRYQDGVLQSEYSGNLVEVCPTGVFTDATLRRHYTRKWDLQMAPSVCVHCAEGCNTNPGERYRMLRRIVNRYHRDINGYFLCDRGRYGYEFVNSDARIRQPLLRGADGLAVVPRARALEHFAQLIGHGQKVFGIGSPRASLESNFALRALVGAERFVGGLPAEEKRLLEAALARLQTSRARSPSLADVEACDAVLVLGEDLPNVAPRMALSVRQATRQRSYQIAASKSIPRWYDQAVRNAGQAERSPLVLATCAATRIDDIASEIYRAAPDDLVRFACAVAHALDSRLPAVPDLSQEVAALVERVAQGLTGSRRPCVICGPSLGSEALIDAAALLAGALGSSGRRVSLAFTAPECNSLGVAMLGGAALDAALQAAEAGSLDTLVVVENDLAWRIGAPAAARLLDKARHLVVLDCIHSSIGERADLVLPCASFAEGEGTLINREPRAQRFFRVFSQGGEVQESWRWLRDVMLATGQLEPGAWQNLDEVSAALARAIPRLGKISQAAAPAWFRMAGGRVPRAPNRYSGRAAMTANLSVHEPETPKDADSALGFQMEGDPRQPPASLTPYFWAPGWNSIQAVNKYQSKIGAELRTGDAGVRLLEPAPDAHPAAPPAVPPAFAPRPSSWLALPLFQIFGSDETSTRAQGLATLIPKASVALRDSDAHQLDVSADEVISVHGEGWTLRLPVQLRSELPAGTVGISAGFPETGGVPFPAWVRLAKS